MLIPNVTEDSTAVLAAWLPGTAGGQGIVDVVTGDYLLRSSGKANTLAFDWPRTMVLPTN
jgi:beta-glucosidase